MPPKGSKPLIKGQGSLANYFSGGGITRAEEAGSSSATAGGGSSTSPSPKKAKATKGAAASSSKAGSSSKSKDKASAVSPPPAEIKEVQEKVRLARVMVSDAKAGAD